MNDILLDNDNDLKIINCDFSVGNSFEQEVKIILSIVKGELKSDPVLGVDLIKNINSFISEIGLKQKIRLNLQRDNKKTGKISIDNGIINIEQKK